MTDNFGSRGVRVESVCDIIKKSNRRIGKMEESQIDAEYERLKKEENIFWVCISGDNKEFKRFLKGTPSSEYYIEKNGTVNFRVKK